MDRIIQAGDIVKSLSGHDKNQLFLVLSIDKFGFLDIINGRSRKIEKPKKKILNMFSSWQLIKTC